MIRRLSWLTGGVAGFWLLTVYPAYLIWGTFGVGSMGFAAVLCWGVAALTLILAEQVRHQAPRLFPFAVLANSGLRIMVVFAAGLVASLVVVPRIEGADLVAVWISLLVFYLYTLVLETILLLARSSPRQ